MAVGHIRLPFLGRKIFKDVPEVYAMIKPTGTSRSKKEELVIECMLLTSRAVPRRFQHALMLKTSCLGAADDEAK